MDTLATAARARPAAALLAFLLAPPALAGPKWASDPDRSDNRGHVFTCQGEGKSEEDALATALGICNDKICKVCGVEVESITETKETLTGVDLQRKVVERCKRVRRGETVPRYKSTECGPDGCQAWVQILYTKADEQAECPRYQKEDFADPAACEKDVQAFRTQEGRTAESFAKRTAQLDAALVHCDKIDVRPTPALMALDEKLRAGLDQFEFTDKVASRLADETAWMVSGDRWGKSAREEAVDTFRPLWGWYLATWPPMRQEFAESKLLTQRIKLVRDLVANKARVMAVLEAAQAKELDSEAGVARLLAALRAAPLGSQYGAPDVHFAVLGSLERLRTSTQAVQAWYREAYPADKLERTAYPGNLVRLFAADKRVTPEEWSWALAAGKGGGCPICARALVAVRDHGGEEVRFARFAEALQQGAEQLARKGPAGPKEWQRAFKSLAPMADPAFLVAVEPRLPEAALPAFEWGFLLDALHRMDDAQPDADQALLLARAAAEAAKAPPQGEDEGSCRLLDAQWKALEEDAGPVEPLFARTCACLAGPLAQQSRSSKSELLDRALARRLPCVRGPVDEGAPQEPRLRPLPLALETPPAAKAAGEPGCETRELKPPRLVRERALVWLRWALQADDLRCTRESKAELSLSVELAPAGGAFREYRKIPLRSALVREGIWQSDVCFREPFKAAAQARLQVVGTGHLAPLSWTAKPFPFNCACSAHSGVQVSLRSAGAEVAMEAKADAGTAACLAANPEAAVEVRVHGGATPDEAWRSIVPLAVLRGLQGAAARQTLPRAKLCAQGVRHLVADVWGVGPASHLRSTQAAELKLDCKGG